MTASAKKSSSTTRISNPDRLALIRAKAEERRAAKAERVAMKAKLDAKAAAEDSEALSACHVILDRMSIRGAEARARRERQSGTGPSRKRARIARAAPITARDVEVDTGKASVRDPYDPSSFITATVNRRVDVLAAERGANRITEAQFLVGRMLQAAWEKQMGVRSGGTWDSTTSGAGPGSLAVSHAFTIEDIRMLGRIETAKAVKAMNERAAKEIGHSGVRFLRAILSEGYSFASYAEARGRGTGERAASDIAKRFRWLLEELTEAHHTARAPGVATIRDGYAAQADAVGERLNRSKSAGLKPAEG
ncbi:hypothetical protein [Methylobacterium gossipiicola]|uniref:Uncharacterized protein n=1 Tax=Methylobacterium gossipiicola TaxID=582675 RepID=A0A1I2TSD1_9HYPH|nr:hypothetical protein [Methylobacterium gossipiicola]SFG65251.1 hypothetical protein SAMN05192565_107167 [Methylobacterium gossipiicola]